MLKDVTARGPPWSQVPGYSKQNSEWEGHFFMKKKINNSFKSSTTFAKMKKHKEIQSTYCNVTKNFHYNSSMNLYDSLIMISCIF